MARAKQAARRRPDPAGAWFAIASAASTVLIIAALALPILPDHPLARFPADVFGLTLGRASVPAMLLLLLLSAAGTAALILQRHLVGALQVSLTLGLIVALATFESVADLASGGAGAGGLVGNWFGSRVISLLPDVIAGPLIGLAALGLAGGALMASPWARAQLGRLGATTIGAGRAAGRQSTSLADWLNARFGVNLEEEDFDPGEAEPIEAAPLPVPAEAEAEEPPELVIKQPAFEAQTVEAGEAEPIEEQAGWVCPGPELLEAPVRRERVSHSEITENASIIEKTLANFKVEVRVVEAIPGPVVTQYCIAPSAGVRVTHITRHADDLALALSARSVRIESPIPGRPFVGLEIPNRDPSVVTIRELLESPEFADSPEPLKIALGKDVADHAQVRSLARMPHLLIAGSTGSGKSVFLNSLLVSLLCQYTPDDMRMVLIDPKMVELVPYNHVPHLLMPVVSTPAEAVPVLAWVQQEMTRRYRLLRDSGRRNLAAYNSEPERTDEDRVPYLVVVVDEMADLMMTAPAEIEHSICRLAQLARAVGIHLVIATQRPSVDVITGLIKANFPSRVAFAVSSQVDSRTILDQSGAEKLMGRGDMLFNSVEHGKSVRVQGAFASDDDIAQIINFWANQGSSEHVPPEEITEAPLVGNPVDDASLYHEAVSVVTQFNYASPALLQRELKLGAGKAADLIDKLAANGIIGPREGDSASRPVLADHDVTVVAAEPADQPANA